MEDESSFLHLMSFVLRALTALFQYNQVEQLLSRQYEDFVQGRKLRENDREILEREFLLRHGRGRKGELWRALIRVFKDLARIAVCVYLA